jgi:NAD(P)-dependent dehydrogenase (short-subunit alcohol dehydrogenase family)
VFISSIMALAGSPGAIAYSASKAALHGMARSMAMEFAPRNIRVNCVAPGFVRTPMYERTEQLWDDEQKKAVEANHPLGIGAPEDIANAVAFLCCDTGRWITGTVLVVDGGYLAR